MRARQLTQKLRVQSFLVTATDDARRSLYDVAAGSRRCWLWPRRTTRAALQTRAEPPHDDLDPNHVANLADYWGEVLGGATVLGAVHC